MKRMLVTGGAGFIGSHFIKRMLSHFTIVNLDLLTYAGCLENLAQIKGHKNYTFVQGDICNSELVNRLFRQYEFDTVVHFAAESHVDRSIATPDIFVKTNVLGTQTLLECARTTWESSNQSDVRFLQVSTDEVYGSLGKEGFFTENTPLSPNSPYSATKASGDLLVQSYHHTYGLPTLITRCSNNYGPYQFPEKLIPLMIQKAFKKEKLPVYGDGLQIRDWLHVTDHCSALELVLQKGRIGEVYNIGGNEEKTNLEIVQLILRQLNEGEEMISFVTDRLGHDRRYAIDNSKIKKELNWTPHYTFEQGLYETILWYVLQLSQFS